MYASGQENRLHSTYLLCGRYGMWTVLLVGAAMMIFGDTVIDLCVGATYANAAPVMLLLFSVSPFIYSNQGTWMSAVTRAEVRPLALREMIMPAVSLLLMVLLLGHLRLGAIGAAVAAARSAAILCQAVISAESVVVKVVPRGSFAAGYPAKPLKVRSIERFQQSRWRWCCMKSECRSVNRIYRVHTS